MKLRRIFLGQLRIDFKTGGSTYEQFLEPGPFTDVFPAVCYPHTYNITIPLIFMFRNTLPMISTWLDIFSSLPWSEPCKTEEFFYIKPPRHICQQY